MSNRIPPSLKWLIDKRARLDAEVTSLEKLVAQFEQLSGRFNKLEASIKRVQFSIAELADARTSLEAIDRALALHHIQVEPANISPVRSRGIRYLEFPYGGMNKLLLTHLKQKIGIAVSTDELSSYVADCAHDLGMEAYDSAKIRQSVRYRLKNLASTGVIERGPSKRLGRSYVATWRLPK